ncbi:MAG: hypothetical protein JXQ87_00110 [Bacteroidia bacterium]
MKKGLSIILFVLFFCGVSLAQIVITGKVYNVATNQGVKDAQVQLKFGAYSSASDFSGYFALNSNDFEKDSITKFIGNMLYWGKAKRADLYDLSGRLIYSYEKGSELHFTMPIQPSGIYLLAVFNGSENEVYKAYCNGDKFSIADDKARYVSSSQSISDTLIVSAKGYRTRKIAIQSPVKILDIGLLPKNPDRLDYLLKIDDFEQFNAISANPSRSNLGQIKALKLVYDIRKDILYYVNTPKHELHYYFCERVIGYEQGVYHFNQHQYTQSPFRYLFLGDLNYYESQDKFVLQFVASNDFTCSQIKQFISKLKETSYFGEKLHFYPVKQEWQECENINIISTEQLYDGQNYQGYNLTETYGYLRKILPNELETEYIGKRDLVLYKGIPNDLPVVAGIITTEFQTPLSHINILSHNRGTPNMTLKNAWENEELDALIGELVYLKVAANGFSIRKASYNEADSFWKLKEPQDTQNLKYEFETTSLVMLENADINFTNSIGAKAANFSELLKVKFKNSPIRVPEGHFAIPFYFYNQHLTKHGIDKRINAFLSNELLNEKPKIRKDRLKNLRDTIMNCNLSAEFLSVVMNEINKFPGFNSFRFRSSTNAEDIKGFSGAGLYDSKSGKKDMGRKSIESAIKTVWASLWNWRAYEERSYYKINHSTCFMGVLVHRSFPNEDANGVVLTTNLYNANPGFIINTQYGEKSIVFPEPGVIHDQIMVNTWSMNRWSSYTIEYLSFSNVPELKGKTVLHNKEIERLMDYCTRIKQRYYYQIKHECNCTYEEFALDIEFKIDSEVNYRDVYIKQVRIYNN